MSLLSLVGGLITPITDLVDKLHTSDAEKSEIKAKVFDVQAKLFAQTLDYEKEIIKSQASIIQSEAKGQSVLQREWRPITMLVFLVLVICDSFGLLAFRLSGEAWTLLQIGLGGYTVGRSAEKIAPHIRDMIKNKQDK